MIASFFSYKGGAGRTTSALNTSYYLAKHVLHPTPDTPLLIIDADTESSGISYLLTKKFRSAELSVDQSLQRFCKDIDENDRALYPDGAQTTSTTILDFRRLLRYFVPVGDQFDVDENAVLLLRSNVHDRDLMMSSEKFVAPINRLVEWTKDWIHCPIIFDTPSGTQPLTNCAMRCSDVIVCHMRPTSQFQQGTREYLKDEFFPQRRTAVNLVLCPSVVPLQAATFDDESYPNAYYSTLTNFLSDMRYEAQSRPNVTIVELMTQNTNPNYYLSEFASDLAEYHRATLVGIPEINRFKWREGLLPPVVNKSKEEKLACERYNYLAHVVGLKLR